MQKTQASLAGLTRQSGTLGDANASAGPQSVEKGTQPTHPGVGAYRSSYKRRRCQTQDMKVGFVSLSLGFLIGEMGMMEIFNPQHCCYLNELTCD